MPHPSTIMTYTAVAQKVLREAAYDATTVPGQVDYTLLRMISALFVRNQNAVARTVTISHGNSGGGFDVMAVLDVGANTEREFSIFSNPPTMLYGGKLRIIIAPTPLIAHDCETTAIVIPSEFLLPWAVA